MQGFQVFFSSIIIKETITSLKIVNKNKQEQVWKKRKKIKEIVSKNLGKNCRKIVCVCMFMFYKDKVRKLKFFPFNTSFLSLHCRFLYNKSSFPFIISSFTLFSSTFLFLICQVGKRPVLLTNLG